MSYIMRRQATLFLAIFLLLLALPCVSMASAAKAEVTSITSKELLNLVATKDKKVVVVNIFASWCPPCRDEIPELVEIRKEFSEDELVIIGISLDKHMPKEQTNAMPKALADFMQEMGFNFPVFYAANGFEMDLGVTAIPQLLIYDQSGDMVLNNVGSLSKAELTEFINKLLKK